VRIHLTFLTRYALNTCKSALIGIVFIFLNTGVGHSVSGQGAPFPPPNQLQVFNAQGLGFGSFYVGSTGGTVVISPAGGRTTTGSVLGLMTDQGMPAIFNVQLVPGRLVHIQFGGTATLTRMGGSETMTINNFTSDRTGNSFVTSSGHPFINPVLVGATLNVGNISANPAGNYQGVFSVTFIQE
jgi:hypothetical protein